MEEYIRKMNEMFEANPYTNNNRMHIYVDNDYVVVRCLNKVECFNYNANGLNDYGVMCKAIQIAEAMYEEY